MCTCRAVLFYAMLIIARLLQLVLPQPLLRILSFVHSPAGYLDASYIHIALRIRRTPSLQIQRRKRAIFLYHIAVAAHY